MAIGDRNVVMTKGITSNASEVIQKLTSLELMILDRFNKQLDRMGSLERMFIENTKMLNQVKDCLQRDEDLSQRTSKGLESNIGKPDSSSKSSNKENGLANTVFQLRIVNVNDLDLSFQPNEKLNDFIAKVISDYDIQSFNGFRLALNEVIKENGKITSFIPGVKSNEFWEKLEKAFQVPATNKKAIETKEDNDFISIAKLSHDMGIDRKNLDKLINELKSEVESKDFDSKDMLNENVIEYIKDTYLKGITTTRNVVYRFMVCLSIILKKHLN